MEETSKPTIRVVVAVIESKGRYLITQRRRTAVLPLMWEFPGGRVETGEDDITALKREVQHRVGIDIDVSELINSVRHNYDHYAVHLHLYECHVRSGSPEAINVHDFRWVKSKEFEKFDFTPADQASVSQLLQLGDE